MRNTTRGFTLIELLVVIAIIAVLAAVAIASFSSARVKSRNAAVLTQVDAYADALNLYWVNNGGQYPGQGSAAARVTRRCFGDGIQTLGPLGDGDCMGNITSTYNSAAAALVQNALQPYMASFPTFSHNAGYASFAYNGCTTQSNPAPANSNTSCTSSDFSLFFALEGANQDCGPATMAYNNYASSGNTICRLMLNNQ